MKSTDEQLIQSFLKEKKQKVEDNGFTRKVMRNLPKKRRSIIPMITITLFFSIAIGLILYYTSYWKELFQGYFNLIHDLINPLITLDYKTVILCFFLLLLTYCLDLILDSN